MKEEFVTTVNYSRLYEAVQGLKGLPRTAPKMGLGFGNFGLGKTFSLERIAAQENALLLRAAQTWSKTSVLSELCEELGVDVSGHSPVKYRRVLESLLSEPRIIIVDEIDALLSDKKTIELTFGLFGYRQSTSISVKRDTLELLKKHGLEEAIVTKETPNKEVMRDWSEEKLALVDAKRVVEDKFWVEAKQNDVEA